MRVLCRTSPTPTTTITTTTTRTTTTRAALVSTRSVATCSFFFLFFVLFVCLLSPLRVIAEQQQQQQHGPLGEAGVSYNPNQLGVPAPPPANGGEGEEGKIPLVVNVYRYGTAKKVMTNTFSTLTELIQIAQMMFSDTKIYRFWSMTGLRVPSLPRLLKLSKDGGEISVIALGKDERFMWPALKVGDEVPLEVDGRKVTIRTIATEPRLFEIDNLIDPEECDHMIERAKQLGLVKSKVGDEAGKAVLDSARTSSQLWVGPGQFNDDAVFSRVRRRVYNLTRLPSDLGEDTQVVHYSVDQHYYAHHDYTRKEYVLDNPYYAAGGNRLITVLYYLNDVEDGGETGFPYINSHTNPDQGIVDYSKTCDYGLKLRPKKGRAAMFYNLKEDGHMEGRVDPWSLHAGCDVHKGEKWLANQWIRNKRVNGQLFGEHY